MGIKTLAKEAVSETNDENKKGEKEDEKGKAEKEGDEKDDEKKDEKGKDGKEKDEKGKDEKEKDEKGKDEKEKDEGSEVAAQDIAKIVDAPLGRDEQVAKISKILDAAEGK